MVRSNGAHIRIQLDGFLKLCVRRWRHGGGVDFVGPAIREVEFALGLARWLPDLVRDELGFAGGGGGCEVGDRHVHFADVLVAEGAQAAEVEDHGLAEDDVVNGESHGGGGVPGGVLAAASVDGGLLLGGRVAGDGNDGVDVHLAEEVDFVEISCGDDFDLKSALLLHLSSSSA